MKLGVLFSSGKDSTYSMLLMKRKKHSVECLITIKSENLDSYMYHTPNIDIVKIQAKSMELPLILKETQGIKEEELEDLKLALKEAIKKYKIRGIVTGALFSSYQKERIEKIASKLNLKVFSPLWHKDQEKYMRELIRNKFDFILTSIAAEGLDKSWLNKKITDKEVDKLVELNKKVDLNIAFEGGEAESFVRDCPLFKKKLKILDYEIIEDNKHVAKLIINKVRLVSK